MRKITLGLLAIVATAFITPAQALDLSKSQSGCIFGEALCSVADYNSFPDNNSGSGGVGGGSTNSVGQAERVDSVNENFGSGAGASDAAEARANELRDNGYEDVEVTRQEPSGDITVTGTKTELIDVVTPGRGEGSSGGDDSTAGSSNGMRGSPIDSGNWD